MSGFESDNDDFEMESEASFESASVTSDEFEQARSGYDDGRDRSPSCRETARRALQEEMKRFLSQGGNVNIVPPNMKADPPRKPTSSYGSRPI